MKIVQLNTESSEKDWERFFEVSKNIYLDSKVWVPESVKEIEKELKKIISGKTRYRAWPLYTVKDGFYCARGVAIIPPGNNNIGWIGYFEVHENYKKEGIETIAKLEEILLKEGIRRIVFPKINNLYAGLQISDFDKPQTILTPHNPNYYKKVLEKSGFVVAHKLNCFFFTKKTVKRIKANNSFILRTFDRSKIDEEIKTFHSLQNKIFEGHNDYISRTLEEERELINGLLPLIDDDLIVIAENSEGKTVGLLICVPDYNQKVKEEKIDRARIISIGVHPDYMRKGIGKQMGKYLMDILIKKGYQSAEASWILKTNMPPQLMAKLYGAKKGRTFAIFEKNYK